MGKAGELNYQNVHGEAVPLPVDPDTLAAEQVNAQRERRRARRETSDLLRRVIAETAPAGSVPLGKVEQGAAGNGKKANVECLKVFIRSAQRTRQPVPEQIIQNYGGKVAYARALEELAREQQSELFT